MRAYLYVALSVRASFGHWLRVADRARVDAERGLAPYHYVTNRGVARAENESIRSVASITLRGAIADAILAYWNEGPTGPHYQNLTGPYTEIGCGGDVRNGILTLVQDFR